MEKELLCTLGPATFNEKAIVRLTELGASLFRINLSHTSVEQVRPTVELIRKYTDVPICLDSEGAQIRTGNFEQQAYFVKEYSVLTFKNKDVVGDGSTMSFHPHTVVEQFEIGDFITIDFNGVLGQVITKNEEQVKIKVLNEGQIGQNKACTINRYIRMNPLTDKDIEIYKIGKELNIKHVALSFANTEDDVKEMRKHCVDDVFVISKIECRKGLQELDGIIRESDAILIDRGDLSREEPIERIPFLQKKIITRAQDLNTKAYVATNLLESMVKVPTPTRAEVNDIYNTLMDGASGLVLAAETAIGEYPLQCAAMIKKLITVFENRNTEPLVNTTIYENDYLVKPHGGVLIDQVLNEDDASQASRYQQLKVDGNVLMDCEQIAFGTYSPLTGFMNKKDLNGVLDNMKLTDGNVWTLPIILQVSESDFNDISVGQDLALTDENGSVHSVLEVEDTYKIDLKEVAEKWFGTTSMEHPGVAQLFEKGNCVVGGKVSNVNKKIDELSQYTMTPKQTRLLFNKKSWSRVIGFHSRNVLHRVHEFIQKEGLELSHADGIYISPVVGPKKKGDFLTAPIFKSYELMMHLGHYPAGKVVIGGFATYSRYSGPREGIFTALCRKNMGCSHFIIGRDHTGVADFYDANATKELFAELGDIGIVPIYFDEIGYNTEKECYEAVISNGDSGKYKNISGTEVRSKIIQGERVPEWFTRPEIQDMLVEMVSKGEKVFW